MRIGLFTDTYFPQVSGVATSIRTLKQELEKQEHDVYIFTTTDKHLKQGEDTSIIRLPSVPFISFTDRRVVYRGLLSSYKIAKKYQLDIIHTQTEFGMGILGKMIAKALKIPVIHTYHTQYEDYVHYFAKGKVITPNMVKYIVRGYLNDLDGVICPSRIVLNVLEDYAIKVSKRVIPTGIDIAKYDRNDLTAEDCKALRRKLGVLPEETMLLSLSRISYEKNIQAILQSLPEVIAQNEKVKLIVVGDGPYLQELKNQVEQLKLTESVVFAGMIDPEKTALYYKAADFFISASTSETQGLTYIESLASGTPIIAHGNPYLDDLIDDPMFGTLYYHESDLADAILDAIIRHSDKNRKKWQEKLYAISAENFGKSVYAFYLDCVISKQMKHRDKLSFVVAGSLEDRSLRVIKKTVSIPKKAVKITTKTSVKVVKAPFNLVKAIQDFLN